MKDRILSISKSDPLYNDIQFINLIFNSSSKYSFNILYYFIDCMIWYDMIWLIYFNFKYLIIRFQLFAPSSSILAYKNRHVNNVIALYKCSNSRFAFCALYIFLNLSVRLEKWSIVHQKSMSMSTLTTIYTFIHQKKNRSKTTSN